MSDPQPPLRIRVGTRGSALALRQTQIAVDELARAHPRIDFDIQVIRTQGDEPTPSNDDSPLETLMPGEGAFVRALEMALREDRIDCAVHSFKDMPSADPEDLVVAAMPRREDPRDVLVSRTGSPLDGLPAGTTIGTGSPRRRAQLAEARPDLEVLPIRGNVDTRLRKVRDGDYGGVVLAAAGLKRLGLEAQISDWLDPKVFVPAIGQGVLALQVRAGDAAVQRVVASIDDPNTRVCAVAERAVARAIQAGCSTPVAAHATLSDGRLGLAAFLLAEGSSAAVRCWREADSVDAIRLGTETGQFLLGRRAEARDG